MVYYPDAEAKDFQNVHDRGWYTDVNKKASISNKSESPDQVSYEIGNNDILEMNCLRLANSRDSIFQICEMFLRLWI